MTLLTGLNNLLKTQEMGIKLDKNTPPMERELEYLLYDLCVNWGFCIPFESAQQISKSSFWNALEFAKAVVLAEGLDPEYEKQWVNKISSKFRERFGSDEIAVTSFTDRVRGNTEGW